MGLLILDCVAIFGFANPVLSVVYWREMELQGGVAAFNFYKLLDFTR